MKYTEIQAKSALHKLKTGKYGFNWDLNIYRGCYHRCIYCYALYSHEQLDPAGGFFGEIYVKTNIANLFEKELSSPRWQREVVNFGGVTDKRHEFKNKLSACFIKKRQKAGLQ